MKKLLKHMNIIYYIFLLLGGVMLLSALPFATQYNTVSINLENGVAVEDATAFMTNSRGQNQQYLWNALGGSPAVEDLKAVYNFQSGINSVNTLILVFGLVMLLAVALLCVLQNHKRKIYYGTNVAAAVIVNLGIVVFAAIILIQLFGLMGQLSSNSDLFNKVAVLQHPTMRAEAYNELLASGDISSFYYVNAATFVGYLLALVVCIVYAVFVLILTFSKFNMTKERRKEILSKAVENND